MTHRIAVPPTRPGLDRRAFLGRSGLAALAAASPGWIRTSPAAGSPYLARPGEPVFLLDGSMIEDLWALRREVQPITRHPGGPLLVRDRPWEGSGPYLGGSVLYDAEARTFRMWYTVFDGAAYYAKAPGSYRVCYATSRDGLAWAKPDLGLVDHGGSKHNNLIRLGRKYVEMLDVVPAPPEAGLAQRYVGLYLDTHGVCLAYSDDGCDWTEHEGNPIERSHSDCHNSLVYDAAGRRWLAHIRTPLRASRSNRRIAVMESADLRTWSRPEVVMLPDESDPPEFYSMPVFQRGNLFFGLVQLFDRAQQHIQLELVLSPDGREWRRVPPRPVFLGLGPPGSFDSGMVGAADSPVVFGDEMRFYYSGWDGDHHSRTRKAAIGLVTVPRDRLYGLASTGTPAAVLSRALHLEGRGLEVNAAVRGTLRVALLDTSGRELAGFGLADCTPLRGDSLRHRVAWKGSGLPADVVRVRCALEDATLYALSTTTGG